MDDAQGAARLLGAWVSDPGDEEGLRAYGRSTLEFAPGGQLNFTAHGASEGTSGSDRIDQIALLDYRVEGTIFVMLSGASVAPENRAAFRIAPGDVLELRYSNRRARYIRRPVERVQHVQQVQRTAPLEGPPAPPEPPPARPWCRFW